MRNTFLIFLPFLFIILCISSCATYQIPIESLKLQFDGIDSSKLVKVIVTDRRGDEEYSFLKNPLKVVKCIDDDNNPMITFPGPRLMMIVTDKENDKTKLSFDRVLVGKTYLYGQSLFLTGVVVKIPLEDIIKVQIRDDRRKFVYGNIEVAKDIK
jgi:hypothetical protein